MVKNPNRQEEPVGYNLLTSLTAGVEFRTYILGTKIQLALGQGLDRALQLLQCSNHLAMLAPFILIILNLLNFDQRSLMVQMTF